MAEIWLAKQTGVEGFEKLVVIKKILPHFTDSKEFVSMFLDEARVAAKLNHPNVVQIYDLGKEQNGYYIAMEFISGADIKEILTTSIKQGHFLPFPFAVNIISQAAEGLYYAHTLADMYGNPMNIVHRDVSPQNILVTYTGTVKIVDFGIAKASTTTQETRAGTLKGKFAYMSPEQALGKPLDGRSDVFALGIILYEITVGKRLFKSDSELKTLRMITEEAIASPVAVNPKYPKTLSDIVMKALARDVNDRYASAREMRIALDDFLKTYPKPSSNLELSAWMRKTFAKTIADTKIRNEKLLREEPDEFLLANILDQQDKKHESGSEVSQLSSLFATANQPLAETGKFSNNSAIMTNIYQQPMTGSSSIQIDNSKSKILLIGFLFVFLAVAGLFALYLVNQKDDGCKIGYTGDNCSVCAKGYQDVNGVCKLLKCPEGHTGKNCTECAIGFQDKDVDGFCKPNCARAKLNCKNGCSDATGIAKCVEKTIKKDKNGLIEIPITSVPSFAKIIINDKVFPKMTDTLLSFEVGKKYVIGVEKDGFKRMVKKITFTKDIKNINFKLEASNHLRGSSKLFIFKNPKEAIVYLDGVKFSSQEKEIIFNSLVEGTHSIQIKLDGYKPYSAIISVSETKDAKINVKLKKASEKYIDISISSIPSKANVYYNNKKIGVTPLANFSIKSSRRYKFKITKKGYHSKTIVKSNVDKEIIVNLSKIKSNNKTNTNKINNNTTNGNTTNNDVTKTKVEVKYGKINMNTNPFTNVYFKGKKIGVTPLFGYKLPVGRHKITLKNDGAFINTTIPIIIRENETLPQVINFRKGFLQIKAIGTPIVTLNGKKIGTGSLKKTLYEGSYRVVLTGMNGVKKYKIKIKPNRTELIEYK